MIKPVKILFYNAVNPFSEIENRQRPLWPAFLAAYAEKRIGSKAFEFRYDSGNMNELLRRHSPDIVCISSVTQNFGYAMQSAAAAHACKVQTIIGGMHISSLPASLTDDMDVACIGEGEQTFADLVTLFLDKGHLPTIDLEKISGITFRIGEKAIKTPPRISRPELDELPHPKRSLVGYGRRSYIYTARGCPYQCVFCACTRFWGKVRYASADYIVAELKELIEHGTRVVRFADENFPANVKRLKELARLVVNEGIDKKLKFSCWCRANDVTPEVVGLLRSINIVSVKLGLESGNERVLRYLKGNVTLEENIRAVHLLHKAGIQVNADFLFGAPDETEAEIMDTYRFIKRSPIAFFDINIFSPLPDTPVWEYAKKKNIVSDTDMRWDRLNYKFNHDSEKAIILSETLTHAQLSKFHNRFLRLRILKGLQALPKSPWLTEIPLVLFKKILEITLKLIGR